MDEVPFDDRHVPRAEIEWDRSAWWWRPITRSIHPATKMLSLVVGLLAIWFGKAGVLLGFWMFQPDMQASTPSAVSTAGLFQSQLSQWVSGLIQMALSFQAFGLREVAFVSFVAMWLTTVFSIFGGVIARRGLVELGQRTVAPWGESLRIVLGRWQSYLWATGMHLVGIAVMSAPILVLGLLSQLGSVGANVAGVLLLLCFPIVFAVGRFALSMFVCFPLSVCAIVAEKKADAFEGFSRSNAYFFQRPVVAFLCVAVLLLIGTIGEQLVYWTLTLGWGVVRGTYFFGGGGLQDASEKYVSAGNWLTSELIRAYWFSFFWTGSAAVYLILRKSVDHTEMDELDSIISVVEQTLPEIPSTPPTADAVDVSRPETPQ